MAILLASIVLFGCDTPSSGDDAWIKDGDTLRWVKENTSEQVLRAFEGFSATDVNNGVVVKVEIGDSKASKAGILFDYEETDGKASYYQLGLGTKGYDGVTPEVYLARVNGMVPGDITTSSSGENPAGGNTEAQTIYLIGTDKANVEFPKEFAAFDGLKMTVYVGFKKESGGSYTLKLGQYDEAEGEWKAAQHVVSGDAGFPTMSAPVTDVNGKLCAYAMLRKAQDGVKVSTDNKYTKVTTTASKLAADAE